VIVGVIEASRLEAEPGHDDMNADRQISGRWLIARL
jgi:hypothetical protein